MYPTKVCRVQLSWPIEGGQIVSVGIVVWHTELSQIPSQSWSLAKNLLCIIPVVFLKFPKKHLGNEMPFAMAYECDMQGGGGDIYFPVDK